ncbi:MAG: tetratricopeptide repeat protein [Microcoleaceae cyanobacterium]
MVQNTTKKPGQSRKRLIRVMTLVSMIAFLGRIGFSTLKPLFDGLNQPQPRENTEVEDINQQLKIQERGYQIVLEREPNNQTALAELLRVRLEMNDKQGVIELLEKLIELNPDRKDYLTLLNQIRQDIADKKNINKFE